MKMRLDGMIAIAVGMLFVYAGAAKFRDISAFAGNIGSFQIAPDGSATILAVLIPLIEGVSGLGTLVPRWRRVSLLSLLSLTIVFLLVVILALARGLDAKCGCFGDGGDSLEATLVRDVILAGVLAVLYWRKRVVPVNFSS